MSSPLPPDKLATLSQLLSSGRKLEAIKLYRVLAGVGLKEAKEEVEALEAAMRKLSPEKFTSAPKSGCLGVLLLAGFCGGGLTGWLLG